MSGHMLPSPLGDWDVLAGVREMAAEAAAHREMTLEMAWSSALYYALVTLAKRQRGTVSDAFLVGAGMWAAIQAREALWRIEQEGLVPLCDLDQRRDAIYEELEALGRRAPEHFDGGRHAFRF